jgi:hypothetical protein
MFEADKLVKSSSPCSGLLWSNQFFFAVGSDLHNRFPQEE